MNHTYKVIVAHPGRQHSYQLATALRKENMLFKYITTVYDKEHSVTNFLMRFMKGDVKKRANTRKSSQLNDDDIILFYEVFGLFLIFLNHLPNKRIWKYFNTILSSVFGKKVAKYAIKHNVDAVICYDTNCDKLFEILKKKAPKIKCIMDVSIANRLYTKNIYIEDMRNNDSKELKEEQKNLWNNKELMKYKKEIEKSDYFLVPSNFVKESLIYSNVKEEKIEIVPYGVDLKSFKFVPKKNKKLPLKLIYVGQVSYRKGIHHLLNVISKYSCDEVIIDVVGEYNSNSKLYQKYKDSDNIIFSGFVTRDKLADKYQSSDVFIMATLSEGFSLAILEAMSCGLPIITTTNSGGNDAIRNYKNGIVFQAGNDKELSDSIDWFLENMDRIQYMSEEAYKTAKNYSWDIYYKNALKTLNKWLDK